MNTECPQRIYRHRNKHRITLPKLICMLRKQICLKVIYLRESLLTKKQWFCLLSELDAMFQAKLKTN